MNERAELQFTFTDIFNDFAVQHEIEGQGFTALYQNFLETQVATVDAAESDSERAPQTRCSSTGRANRDRRQSRQAPNAATKSETHIPKVRNSIVPASARHT